MTERLTFDIVPCLEPVRQKSHLEASVSLYLPGPLPRAQMPNKVMVERSRKSYHELSGRNGHIKPNSVNKHISRNIVECVRWVTEQSANFVN